MEATKYYIDANMAEAYGACGTARAIMGDKKIPINSRTIRKILTTNRQYASRIAWPSAELLHRINRITLPSNLIDLIEDRDELQEIEDRLYNIGIVMQLDRNTANNKYRIRSQIKNGKPSKALVDEVVRLMNRTGDLFQKWGEEINATTTSAVDNG